MKSHLFLSSFLCLILSGCATQSESAINTDHMGNETHSENTLSEGEQLERQTWEQIKNSDLKALESKIAPEFQSVHPDGVRDKEAELKLLKNFNLDHFTLSHFKITEIDDTLIITYLASADETINNKRISGNAGLRMSIWKKKNDQWQWIAHANLTPL